MHQKSKLDEANCGRGPEFSVSSLLFIRACQGQNSETFQTDVCAERSPHTCRSMRGLLGFRGLKIITRSPALCYLIYIPWNNGCEGTLQTEKHYTNVRCWGFNKGAIENTFLPFLSQEPIERERHGESARDQLIVRLTTNNSWFGRSVTMTYPLLRHTMKRIYPVKSDCVRVSDRLTKESMLTRGVIPPPLGRHEWGKSEGWPDTLL